MDPEMKGCCAENNDAQEKVKKKSEDDDDAFEAVLTHVGDMGRYQQLLFALMLPFGLFYAWIYLVQMFIAATPEKHWCAVPELAHLDMEIRRNLSAPGAATGNWDKCSTFDVNWTQVLESMTPPSSDTPTVLCQHGWDYELTDIPYATVVTERDWVCENAGHVPMAQAIFFGGAFVGGLFFGWFADHFGRLPALIGSNLIGGICGIATIYTTDVWDFALCRFLVGMSFDNAFIMAYILVLEYVGPSHRTWVSSMSIALYFGAGCLSLPWIAVWLKDWRMLLWVTSAPMLLVLFAPLVIPESARWYVSRGRISQAVKVLRKFEKVNGTKIPDDAMDEFIVSSNQSAKQTDESLLALFKSGPLRLTMILMLIVYMSSALVYDGLVRLTDSVGLDFFITFTLTSATEIPSIVLLACVLDKIYLKTMETMKLSVMSQVSSNQTAKQTDESLLALFKSGPLRLTMILMLIVYISCALVFDGLVRLSDSVGLDFFITFTLTSATEIPSNILLVCVLDKWGRRNLTVGPMSLAGILIIIAMFMPKGIPQASLAIMARFCINMSYTAVIQWATELLPTTVRASGTATLHMSGYVVAVLSPYIVYSERVWSLLPLLILGIVALIASGLSILLPETNGRPMPQTILDGERLVREQTLCGKVEDVEDSE